MICAGIVTFNPEIKRLNANINKIKKQVSLLIVVDNGSDNYISFYKKFCDDQNIIFIENKVNKGIAFALNQLCNEAKNRNYNWLLTLDQDSICCDNLIAEYEKYIEEPYIGIICPRIKNREEFEEYSLDKNVEYVERCITSGSLLNIKIWKDINGFDEKMFIDLVDFEYCFRLIKANYKILRVNKTYIDHCYGEKFSFLDNILKKNNYWHISLIKKLEKIKKYDSTRLYYYTRNSVYFIKKYKNDINIKKKKKQLFNWIIVNMIFQKKKIVNIKAIINGLRDGCKL